MQASVHRFDPRDGSGAVLTDDGRVLAFGPEAFGASRLRLLRPGQRLTVQLDENEQILGLRLGGIGGAPSPPSTP